MARTAIVPTACVPASATGVASNLVAVDASASPNGMSYPAAPKRVVRVKTTGTIITVTVQTGPTQGAGGLALTPRTVTLPATGDSYLGPYGAEHTQPDGNVYLNFSVATGGTIEVIDPGP
jgi:hypothetical protein